MAKSNKPAKPSKPSFPSRRPSKKGSVKRAQAAKLAVSHDVLCREAVAVYNAAYGRALVGNNGQPRFEAAIKIHAERQATRSLKAWMA